MLEVADYGVVPLPPERGGYLPDDVGALRDDLQPIEISGGQPRALAALIAARLDGPYEGLVLHTVGYEDRGRVRPILHRASVSEMVVP